MSRPHPQALAVADAVADRLADPSRVLIREGRGGRGRSRPQSLAGGLAGIALLHIERALGGYADWDTAHTWLTAATRDDLSAGPNAGLFFGAPTLAFVLSAAVDRPMKLRRALSILDASTIALTRRRLDAAHARISRGERPALAEFDLIRGLSGLAALHLRRHPDHEITKAVLSYLVRLTAPLPGSTGSRCGWWTDLAPTGEASPSFPSGHGNLGLSHGVSGPLAVLSLALRRGVTVAGHIEAIARVCRWLDTWKQESAFGPWWPGIVTVDEQRSCRPRHANPHRPSWCYGTPGIARAQQLAGLATGDVARQRVAEAAMLGCLSDPTQLARIAESGLCHGLAGLLQVTYRMAADSAASDISAHLPHLSARLLSRLRTTPEQLEPEFLDGQAGIALALRTVGTGAAPLSQWDACLLLA